MNIMIRQTIEETIITARHSSFIEDILIHEVEENLNIEVTVNITSERYGDRSYGYDISRIHYQEFLKVLEKSDSLGVAYNRVIKRNYKGIQL